MTWRVVLGCALASASLTGCGTDRPRGSDTDAASLEESTLDGELDCPAGQEMVAGFEEVAPDQARFQLADEAADAKIKYLGYQTSDVHKVSPASYSIVVDGQEVLIVHTVHDDDGWVVAS